MLDLVVELRIKTEHIDALIGPQIDPGVLGCHAQQQGLHLALKSGGLCRADFFNRAFTQL